MNNELHNHDEQLIKAWYKTFPLMLIVSVENQLNIENNKSTDITIIPNTGKSSKTLPSWKNLENTVANIIDDKKTLNAILENNNLTTEEKTFITQEGFIKLVDLLEEDISLFESTLGLTMQITAPKTTEGTNNVIDPQKYKSSKHFLSMNDQKFLSQLIKSNKNNQFLIVDLATANLNNYTLGGIDLKDAMKYTLLFSADHSDKEDLFKLCEEKPTAILQYFRNIEEKQNIIR